MKKLAVVVTSRASYYRVKEVLFALRGSDEVEPVLILGGSMPLYKYGTPSQVVKADGFDPRVELFTFVEGENLQTMAKSVGLAILDLTGTLRRENPDALLTIADRFETMANAISASYMNIPLIHLQGGEVTGSIDDKVRHAITKLSDYHLVSTNIAKERVLRMGEPKDRVFMLGCPSIDLAAKILREPAIDFDPFSEGGLGSKFPIKSKYIILMQHSVTTQFNDAFDQMAKTLQAVKKTGMPVFVFWPNPDAGTDGVSKAIRLFREREEVDNFYFFKNLPSERFLKLLKNSAAIVGNSSVAIREGSFLGIPAVNIGDRQKYREKAENVVSVGHDEEEIFSALERQVSHGHYPSSQLYGDGNSAGRIVDMLETTEFKLKEPGFFNGGE